MDILILICGLFCGYVIYSKGVKDGIAVSKGKEVTIVPNPVKEVKKSVKLKKETEEEKQFMQAFDNLMSYDGTKQKVGE